LSRTWKSRVGVLALTATMGIGLAALASPAVAADANAAAKASCKDDGWKTLVRADGTLFKNQGDCVSYAAQGGTLAPRPLPDLIPFVSCSFGATGWSCDLFVENQGNAPATGDITNTFTVTGVGTATLSFHLSGLAPGQGTPVQNSFQGNEPDLNHQHVTASVDNGNAIAESNESNNTLDETVSVG